MRDPAGWGIDIAWHQGPDGEQYLREHLARVVGGEVSQVRTGRLCPQCGSAGHGRPWARIGERQIPVSLARSQGHLVTAVAGRNGPESCAGSQVDAVGVDVESIAKVEKNWSARVILAPGENATTALERAYLWCAKEAVAKVVGTGLALGPDQIVVSEHHVLRLAAPEGYTAVLAVRWRI